MSKINALVVDDSAFMRKSLSLMLESDPDIEVIATARDGIDCLEKIRQFKPDIVTLDIEMPKMDGLSALEIIMKEMPVPVLIVSSLSTDGAEATLKALEMGAVDFIPKALSFVSFDIAKIRVELISKVKSIVKSLSLKYRIAGIRNARKSVSDTVGKQKKSTSVYSQRVRRDLRAIVVGVSTGGPKALMQIIPRLPADFPLGIAVVQHMPPKFTASLANRLNCISSVRVKEAEDGDRFGAGKVLIAPGGYHMRFIRDNGDIITSVSTEPSDSLYRPAADIMMLSAVEAYNTSLLGVILTGMGKDGLAGMQRVKEKGGYVIAQDEESCVVYGMPKAAVDAGVADAILPLEKIASSLVRLTMG
jgi:two-component system, chemotaxis family, protein-glutamate methylesterase/glutaminase